MVDFDALEAAGIADARQRAPLIEYLDQLGFTAAEMVEAESRGRLFGLAGDVLQWSGPMLYCLADAAAEIGVPLADVERAWAALGLTVTDCATKSLSRADVEALRTWAGLRLVVGDVAATGLLRVIGAGMARLAEAESSMMRASSPEVQIEVSHDELATARAYRAAVGYLPRIGATIEAVHRQHLMSARTYFEHVVRDESPTVVCGIGFADLSGFTALTQLLSAAELSDLLNEFGATAADVVHAAGGRVVKFIGDAVMWVSSTPQQLVAAAVALVENVKARDAGLQVRAGLGYGEVLAISGDYFGNPVNLAARLTTNAEPGQILSSSALRDALPDHDFAPARSFTLKGFDVPVTAYPLQSLIG